MECVLLLLCCCQLTAAQHVNYKAGTGQDSRGYWYSTAHDKKGKEGERSRKHSGIMTTAGVFLRLGGTCGTSSRPVGSATLKKAVRTADRLRIGKPLSEERIQECQ